MNENKLNDWIIGFGGLLIVIGFSAFAFVFIMEINIFIFIIMIPLTCFIGYKILLCFFNLFFPSTDTFSQFLDNQYAQEIKNNGIQKEGMEYISELYSKFGAIKKYVLENEFDEGLEQLLSLKEEMDGKKLNSQCNNEKIKFINKKLNPLIKKCRLQKEIMDKCNTIFSEFKTDNENPEIAIKFFNYYRKINKLYSSSIITKEFFNLITDFRNRINWMLKERLIERKMKIVLCSEINYDFLLLIARDYFDILKRWRILQSLPINLSTIKFNQFKKYFENGSVKRITTNIEIFQKNFMQECFLQNIGLLVKSKKEIQKYISRTI